jgi:phosphoribosylformylglycinamidine cyclo-ligase
MISYKDAGVDIASGNALVERLQALCPEIGGFGGLYPLGNDYLVASTDGVGTKLKLAFELQRHHTIGIDLVAMCVNDIVTSGARPLFLLDYFATSRLDVSKAEQVIQGVIAGCQEAGCVLLGGETAEMPGFYQSEEYDIAGFSVGIVAKKELIDGKSIRQNDLLVGIASSGIHSNGFSLVREAIKRTQTALDQPFNGTSQSIGEVLLTPTLIYVNTVFEILKNFKIKGIAHITGGGLVENVPRILPQGMGARIEKKSWTIPPIFLWLQEKGSISEEEMYRTFNMGIGLVMALDPKDAELLCRQRTDCRIIGEVCSGEGEVAWS